MANNDGSLIDQFFDLQALINQQNEILKKNAEFAKTMKSSFSDTLKGQDVSGLQSISKEIAKVVTTTTKAKAAVTDYEKAQANLAKQIAQNNVAKQELNKILDNELYSTNELIAQNKLLEAVRRNLNSSDKDYEANQRRIIAAQDKNNAKIKEYQTLENQRISGIGKYKQAIEEAMAGEGNYRTQLLKLRNTMAELEGEIEKATEKYGENSQQVKDLTAEYTRMEQRAGKLTDAQGDMQQRINYLADDYGKFKAVLAGVQAAMGIVSVFSGFTNLLGIHSERVEKVTAKMASMLAVMQGLSQVQELLNRDNYFVQFIKNTPRLNNALSSVTAWFTRMKGAILGFLGVAGFIAGAILGIRKVLKAARENEFYDFNKELEKTTDKAERLKIATSFLEKQFGSFSATLVSIKDAAAGVAKSFDDIIEKMVQLTLMREGEAKLQEVISAAFVYAQAKDAADKRLKELQETLALQQKVAEEDAKNTNKSNVLGMSGGGAAYKAGQQLAAKSPIQETEDEIKAVYNSLNELYKNIEIKSSEYNNVMELSAQEVSKIVKDLTKDYSEQILEIAGTTEKGGENVKKSLKETGEEVDKFAIKAAKFKKVDFFDRNMSENISKFDSKLTDFATIINELEQERLTNLNIKIEELRQRLYSGAISIDEYNKQLQILSNQSIKEGLLNQIEFLQVLADTTPKGEGLKAINAELEKLKKELNDINFEDFVKKIDEDTIVQKFEKITNSIRDIFNTLSSSISDAFSQSINREEELLQRADSRYERSYEARKLYIENNIADEGERTEALNALEVERLDNKARTDRKEAELEARKARFDNALEIVRTQVELAAAIASAVAASSAGDPYTTAARIAAAVAAGIAAMAAVASAISQVNTIPAYEKGGDVKKDIIFRAGEKGAELGFGQQTGKVYNFNKDGLYKVKENVKIMDANKSRQIMQQQTINNNKEVNLRNVVYVKVVDNQRVKKYFKNI